MRVSNIVLILCLSTSVFSQDSKFSAQDAIRLALEQNLSIQLAQTNVDIASINNNWGNAGALPIITANIANTEALSNIDQKLSSGSEIQRSNVANNTLNSNIGVSWRIYNGYKIKATKERFTTIEQIGEIAFKQQIDQVIYDVLNSYYNIVRLNKQIASISAIIDLSKERLKIAETRFNVGSGAKTDMLQAKIDLNAQEINLQNIQKQVQNSIAIINTLLKREPSSSFEASEVQFSIPTIDYKSMSEKIESQNHDILIAEKERSLLINERKIINAQRIPTATLNSNTFLNRSQASAGLFLINQSYGPNIGLTFGIPIFNGNIYKTQLKVNAVMQKQKGIEVNSIKNDLKRDLLIAYQEYQNAVADAKIEETNVTYAEENNMISTERFKKLQSNSIELRQAQLSLSEAQDRYINAQYRAQVAAYTLKFITGEISKF